MQKIKVAILKGRKELEGSSGVDYFTLNLYRELKKQADIEPTLIYGNYVLPGMFKFLHFNNLDNFDLIHNCVPGLGMFVRTRKPILTTLCDDIMFRPKLLIENFPLHKKIKTLLIKKLWSLGLSFDLSRSDKLIAISKETKLAFEKRLGYSNKIGVIPPGVNTDVFKPLPNIKNKKRKDVLRLFYCGRLCYRKGTDLLLDAVSILINKYKLPVKLYLAGTTDRNFNLENEIDSRDLNNNIIYLRNISDREVEKNYNLSDIFVFPSRAEGYGIPPIEALSCGTKVVSTSVPSVQDFPEVMKVDINKDSIAQGIKMAINQKINYKKIREKIEKKHSLFFMGTSYIKIYKEMLKKY